MTDAPKTDAPVAAQPDMDDIMSSIRDGVAEEGGKVGSGSADLIDAAAAAEPADDDVMDLSEADMVAAGDAGASAAEELIDLAAFGASGAETPAKAEEAVSADPLSAEPVNEAEVADAADEFDRLLAEISQEQDKQAAANVVNREALLAEEEPLGDEAAVEDETEAAVEEPVAAPMTAEEALAEKVTAAAVEAVAAPAVKGANGFELGLVQGVDGVQVAFPAEILAMALRPMVTGWLEKNLPDVVEKLVKEEISKLAQG